MDIGPSTRPSWRQFQRDGALDHDSARRRQRRLAVWFYLGVPLALGFLLGWLQVGRTTNWPREISLLYWLGVSLTSTSLLALGTSLVAPLLRRLRSPLWLTLLGGQFVGGLLFVDPMLRGYRLWLQANVYPDLVLTSATTLGDFVQRLPSNALLWIGVNLAFFYGLAMPRFGYRPATGQSAEDPAASSPLVAAPAPPAAPVAAAADEQRESLLPLMARVRLDRRGALLALEADGHYLRVYTDAGSDLILYRLSDALIEVAAEDGAQVHRSWWVAARALTAERHGGTLSLVNGVEVPVSRSFRVAARQRGWLRAGVAG